MKEVCILQGSARRFSDVVDKIITIYVIFRILCAKHY